MRVGVLLVGLALLVGVVSRADASSDASAFEATFKVVGATHSSSSRKSDPPFYNGSSTSTWSLAPATKAAPNVIQVASNSFITTGIGQVNIRGVFKANATTNRPGKCSLVAATGDKKHGFVAPGPFQLSFSPDPKSKSRVLVAQGLGFNIHATLGNPYFPSECSTSVSGEPSVDARQLKSMPKSVLRQKTIVIRYSGSTTKEKIVYRWSTTFTLKRVKFTP